MQGVGGGEGGSCWPPRLTHTASPPSYISMHTCRLQPAPRPLPGSGSPPCPPPARWRPVPHARAQEGQEGQRRGGKAKAAGGGMLHGGGGEGGDLHVGHPDHIYSMGSSGSTRACMHATWSLRLGPPALPPRSPRTCAGSSFLQARRQRQVHGGRAAGVGRGRGRGAGHSAHPDHAGSVASPPPMPARIPHAGHASPCCEEAL